MKKYLFIVIAIVLAFLAMIVAYTMTPSDDSVAGAVSVSPAKH